MGHSIPGEAEQIEINKTEYKKGGKKGKEIKGETERLVNVKK